MWQNGKVYGDVSPKAQKLQDKLILPCILKLNLISNARQRSPLDFLVFQIRYDISMTQATFYSISRTFPHQKFKAVNDMH